MIRLGAMADRIQCGMAPAEVLTVAKPIIEKSAIKIRSIYRTFTNNAEQARFIEGGQIFACSDAATSYDKPSLITRRDSDLSNC